MLVSHESFLVKKERRVLIAPMKRGPDLKPPQAAAQLRTMLTSLDLSSSSIPTFGSVIDLHRMALESDVFENQLLNLWTAFETFVPTRKEKSRIQAITASIVPFLKLNYVHILLKDLARDLINWDNQTVSDIINKIPYARNYTLVEKVASVIVLPEHRHLRDELFEHLDRFILLRNRCHMLADSLKDSKSIRKLIRNHGLKVSWQVHRIYRTRNMIVHKSSMPPYTSILIENAHTYLDTLLSQLMELASDKHEEITIAQAIELVSMKMSHYEQYLADNNEECSATNFKHLLFNEMGSI